MSVGTRASKSISNRVVSRIPVVGALGGPRQARRLVRSVRAASEDVGGPMELARELVTSMPAVVRALAALARDKRVPLRYRAALMSLVPYLLSPVDPIPDFIPVVGAMDDAVLVLVVVRWVIGNVDHDLLEEHWRGSPVLLRLLREAST